MPNHQVTRSPDRQIAKSPNVLVIIADDLTYGDLVCYGNPYTHTPNLDALHSQSTCWERHTSGSLCTPARSMLMTGRYAYRTRAIDTYCGRSMIDPGERTLGSILGQGGYETCLSGKWHLGDCYPMRPQDMGFDEVLMHNGGGLCQPANHGHDDYFDPDLMHNGKLTPSRGYCTDIFADHTINFIRQHGQGRPDQPEASDNSEKANRPLFCYLATNTPHTPCLVGDAWARPHLDAGLDEQLARLYGMIDNLDMNIGRVLDTLDELGLAQDTLVYFTSDHGCQSDRFNAGLRGGKASPYDGGIRTPAFWRWPGHIPAGTDLRSVTGQIDVVPTIAHACEVDLPTDRIIDGQSMFDEMTNQSSELTQATQIARPGLTQPDATASSDDDANARLRVIQWHRGDQPIRRRNVAVVGDRFKLCISHETADPELYDTVEDPGERTDLAADQPQRVDSMLAFYDHWFDDVSSTRADNYAPPRIIVGSEHENPTVLNMNDWRVYTTEGFKDTIQARWMVYIHAGAYDIELRFNPVDHDRTAYLRIGEDTVFQSIPAGADQTTFTDHQVAEGDTDVEAWAEDGDRRSATFVIFTSGG